MATPEFTRREFMQAVASSSLALLFASCSATRRTVGFHPPAKSTTPFITSNEDFFVVAVDPSYRPAITPETVHSQWWLELIGLNDETTRIGYDDLSVWAKRTIPYTLECIGNPVGGQLIGNAQWDVVPLREILARAPGGIRGARAVHFEALDGFYSSVSVERATDDYAFVAMRMNRVPLPAAHGFPARVLLPDLYGKKQPRWLKQISLSEDPTTSSYWEQRGWAGEVPVKTFSRFDLRRKLPVGQLFELSGIAFAGRRGISKVEISIDYDERWFPCTLVTGQYPNVWSLWRHDWQNPSPGRHTFWVRAVDGTGSVQTKTRQRAFPDGVSGYHEIEIDVGSV